MCFFMLFQGTYAQTLELTIINENNEPVNNGFILINSFNNPANSLHYIPFKQSTINIPTQNYNEDLLLIVKSNGFVNDTIFVKKEKLTEKRQINAILKNANINLEEVVIEAKQKPFKIKEDTIVYKIKGYGDGSERKLEDILKKLPGIEVNNATGIIKYKGKPIETIMLEGDNLFGKDYTIGSKNINIDLIEEVEGIENYSENILLKGLDDQQKTALNLKLKKGAFGLSAESETGLGSIEEKRIANDLATTILGVSAKIKSFAVISNNNIGIDRSSSNYYINSSPAGYDNIPNKIVTDNFPVNQIDKNYNFINDQFLTDINTVFSLSPKLKVKAGGAFVNDNLDISRTTYNRYIIEGQTIENNDVFSTAKKNQIFKSNIKLMYSLTSRSNLEWDINGYNNNRNTSNSITSATSLINNYDVLSDVNLFKSNINYTNKINSNTVLRLIVKNNYNSIKQDMPYFNSNTFQKQVQNADVKRTGTLVAGDILGRSLKLKSKYNISAGYDTETSKLLSSVQNIENSPEDSNDTKYTKSTLYNFSRYSFNVHRWTYSLNYKLSLLDQKLKYNTFQQGIHNTTLLFEPGANIKLVLNKISYLDFSAGYNQQTMAENYLYINPVLTDNRNTISANTALNLSKNIDLNIMYFRNDLYNQFQNTITVSYQNTRGNFITRSLINENFITTNYFFNAIGTTTLDVNYMVSKYVPGINSTLKYTVSYNYSTYNNFVNESDLRKNVNHFVDNEVFAKTSFAIPFNFENSFKYRYNTSIGDKNETFTNQSINNNFKIIYKLNAFTATAAYNYFVPDTKIWSNKYNFLDFTARYSPKNSKYDVSLIANNISNVKSFTTIQTSDVSLSMNNTTIIPRHILIKLNYRF